MLSSIFPRRKMSLMGFPIDLDFCGEKLETSAKYTIILLVLQERLPVLLKSSSLVI